MFEKIEAKNYLQPKAKPTSSNSKRSKLGLGNGPPTIAKTKILHYSRSMGMITAIVEGEIWGQKRELTK